MKQYAVVRVWKNNLKDFQVLEYVETIHEGEEFIQRQKKSELYEYDIYQYTGEDLRERK